jgi:type IV pilus assembly protein PilC
MLPNVFSSLIRVGESSGSLEETLGHAERIYVEEIESILDSLGAVIEPALLVVVGALVGGILLSVLLPYFSLVQNIGGLSGP